jgi:hypothetical protein
LNFGLFCFSFLFRCSISSLLGFASLSKLKGNDDDDWVDRLNHVITVVILLFAALFVGSSQYIGDPISCWTPKEFTGAFDKYTKSYCWIKNTYYIPMDDTIPISHVDREDEEITYYQWTPIILLLMAGLFKMPCLMWRMLNGYSGINIDKVVNMTVASYTGLEPKKREGLVDQIAMHLDRWLETNRQYHTNFMVRVQQKLSKFLFLCNKREGTFLTGLYLFVKILYLTNIVAQFFILDAFMGGFFSMYGIEVMNFLVANGELRESPRFPRITLCDFDIRQLNNIQRFTVQCVLPVNLFNEKIFIFIWFWYFLVAVCTVGGFAMWIWRIVLRRNRGRYVRKYLRTMNEILGEEDKRLSQKFADEYLRDDGLFLLRLVAKNSTDILLRDIIAKLWFMYKDKPLLKRPLSEDGAEESLA